MKQTMLRMILTVCLALSVSGCFQGHRKIPVDTVCAWAGPHFFEAPALAAMTDEEIIRESDFTCQWIRICEPGSERQRQLCPEKP